MNIIEHVNHIRDKSKQYGRYRVVAERSGVTYHWLQQFAIGKIKNPTVENVAKLEAFFSKNEFTVETHD